jgi:hypothetical protein
MVRAIAVALILAVVCFPTNKEGYYCDNCDVRHPPEQWECIASGRPVWKVFCAQFWTELAEDWANLWPASDGQDYEYDCTDAADSKDCKLVSK